MGGNTAPMAEQTLSAPIPGPLPSTAHRVDTYELRQAFTPEEVLRETGRLLEHSKQLVERVVNDWQIEPERYQKSLSDSVEVVARYTRWAVTGALMQELMKEENPDAAGGSTWQAAKAVRAPSPW